MLAVAEIALALVVLVGAGLMARTFWNLQRVNAGFSADHVLTFELDVPHSRYKEDAKYIALFRRLTDRLRALPGVQTVGMGSDLPWTGYDENSMFSIVGKKDARGADETDGARYHFVTPDYFRAIGTPLVKGRFYNDAEDPKSPLAVIVNQSLATRYFPEGNAVGSYITTFNSAKKQIVGVVADVQDSPSGTEAKPAIYFNDWQSVGGGERYIAVRTTGDWRPLAASVAREVAAIDPDLPVLKVRPLADVSAQAISFDAIYADAGGRVWCDCAGAGGGGRVWRDFVLGDAADE